MKKTAFVPLVLNKPLVIAQISDSHLFEHVDSLHHGVNVYHNLCAVLSDIVARATADFIIFTGDLTQDHSQKSYQLFAQAVKTCQVATPLYLVSGNHDEPYLFNKLLTDKPFCQQKLIETPQWQLFLLDSKSDTPSGYVANSQFSLITKQLNPKKHQFCFMHHHPVKVGYFIDQHGLENEAEFWEFLASFQSIKGLACGHIHRGLTLYPDKYNSQIPVFTCPATSIQFDPQALEVKALKQSAGYRILSLGDDGSIETQLIYL